MPSQQVKNKTKQKKAPPQKKHNKQTNTGKSTTHLKFVRVEESWSKPLTSQIGKTHRQIRRMTIPQADSPIAETCLGTGAGEENSHCGFWGFNGDKSRRQKLQGIQSSGAATPPGALPGSQGEYQWPSLELLGGKGMQKALFFTDCTWETSYRA